MNGVHRGAPIPHPPLCSPQESMATSVDVGTAPSVPAAALGQRAVPPHLPPTELRCPHPSPPAPGAQGHHTPSRGRGGPAAPCHLQVAARHRAMLWHRSPPRGAAAVRPIAVPTADPTSSTGGKTSHGAPGAPRAVPLSLSACAGAPSSLIKSNGPALPRAPARLAAPPGHAPGRCAVSSKQRHNKTPAVSWPGAQPAVPAGLPVAQQCVCPRCLRSPRRSARR